MNIITLKFPTKHLTSNAVLVMLLILSIFSIYHLTRHDIDEPNFDPVEPHKSQDSFETDKNLELILANGLKKSIDADPSGATIRHPTKIVIQGFKTNFAQALFPHLFDPGFEKTFFLFDMANSEDVKKFYPHGFTGSAMIAKLDAISKCNFSKDTMKLLMGRNKKRVSDSASKLSDKFKDDILGFAQKLKTTCEESDMRIVDGSGTFAIVTHDQYERLNHTHHIFIMPGLKRQITIIKSQPDLQQPDGMNVPQICKQLQGGIYTQIKDSKTTFMLTVSKFLESRQEAFHILRHSIWSEISPYYDDVRYELDIEQQSNFHRDFLNPDELYALDHDTSCLRLREFVPL